MTIREAFDLIEAGQGRWDVQLQGTLTVAGHIWRTTDGFTLFDWLDRSIGVFPSTDDALRFLLRTGTGSARRLSAA
ncbi:hypothetical protein [Planctomonas psychrotolerans]|uniref:hypothetical protein n=1 Tax=Planctomonas psychrotolerans TaxID=2528712 RepID=UPI00123843E5|nr:hypothetical protein [Planctomonas psychrotolerans]